MDEMFEIIKAGAPDAPPEQALYRIQQTYPDGSGGRLNVDWEGLLRLHELIHDRVALEGHVCETCSTKGCHRPATWEIECRGAGVSGRLIYSCDEHCPDPAILSPDDEIRRRPGRRPESGFRSRGRGSE